MKSFCFREKFLVLLCLSLLLMPIWGLSAEPFVGYLFTTTRDGVLRIGPTGDILNLGTASKIASLDGELYMYMGPMIVVTDVDGRKLRQISMPGGLYVIGFTVLKNIGFAIFNNKDDLVYFVSVEGKLVATVPLPGGPDDRLQNMYGVVVDKTLIISEDGQKRLIAIDLDNFSVSVFRDLSNLPVSWLGAIAYASDHFYVAAQERIFAFEITQEPDLVAKLPTYNITGLVVIDHYLYACTNFGGAIYRVDLATGVVDEFVTGLNYPSGLVFIPKSP